MARRRKRSEPDPVTGMERGSHDGVACPRHVRAKPDHFFHVQLPGQAWRQVVPHQWASLWQR